MTQAPASMSLCHLRTYSTAWSDLHYPEYCFRVEVDLSKKLKDYDRVQHLTEIIIGLLNTSGGIVRIISSKGAPDEQTVDTWKLNLTEHLQTFLPHNICRDCVDFVITEGSMFLVVKKSKKVITLCSHLYMRNIASSTLENNLDGIAGVIRCESTDPYQDPFDGLQSLHYGDTVDVHESKCIEFKSWKIRAPDSQKTYTDRLRDPRTLKTIFAFANSSSGGYLIIGIKEADGIRKCNTVEGQVLSEKDQQNFPMLLEGILLKDESGRNRLWGNESRTPALNRDWTVRFIAVDRGPPQERRMVIVICMKHVLGGMFAKYPESYVVNEDGHVCPLTFTEWKSAVLSSSDRVDHYSVSVQPGSRPNLCSLTTKHQQECSLSTHNSHKVKEVPKSTNSDQPMVVDCHPLKRKSHTEPISPSKKFKFPNDILDGLKNCNIGQTEETRETPKLMAKHESIRGVGIGESAEPMEQAQSDPKILPGEDTVYAEDISWTKLKRWTCHLNDTGVDIESNINKLCGSNGVFRAAQPTSFTPGKGTIIYSQGQEMKDSLQEAITYIELDAAKSKSQTSIKSFGIAATRWCSNMRNTTSLGCPIHHIMDIFIADETGRLKLWIIVGEDASDKNAWEYVLLSGRLTKRNLLRHHVGTAGVYSSLWVDCRVYRLGEGEVNPPVNQDFFHSFFHAESGEQRSINLSLARTLLQKNTRMFSIFGDELSISLTTEQMEVIISVGLDKFNYITGPPGSGKTILALHLYEKYTKCGYVVNILTSTASMKKYFIYQTGAEECIHVAGDKLSELLHSTAFQSVDVLIVDDAQNIRCTKKVWQELFSHARTSLCLLVILGDSELQQYDKTIANSKKLMTDFCDRENLPMFRKDLTVIHRNTRMVVSFMNSSLQRDSPLSCTREDDGHDIEMKYLPFDVKKSGGFQSICDFVTGLVVPKDTLDNKSQSYEANDIAILLDTPGGVKDAKNLGKYFKEYIKKSSTPTAIAHDASTFPVTGYTVDTLKNFVGLDRKVCILVADEEVASSQQNVGRSFLNPKYKVFVASRGIARVIFAVNRLLNRELAETIQVDDFPDGILCLKANHELKLMSMEGKSLHPVINSSDMEEVHCLSSDARGSCVAIAGRHKTYCVVLYRSESGSLQKCQEFRLDARATSIALSVENLSPPKITVLQGKPSGPFSLVKSSDGMRLEKVESKHVTSCRTVSIDPNTDEAYLADQKGHCIRALKPDGSYYKDIVMPDVENPAQCTSTGGSLFVNGRNSKNIHLYHAQNSQSRLVLKAPDIVSCLCVFGGRYLAVGMRTGLVLYDVSKVVSM